MPDLLQKVSSRYVKPTFTQVKSGDTVRVSTKVKEGEKTRTQSFEGLVIRRRGGIGPNATFTVRRVTLGVGVERTFPLHSPVISQIQVVRGAKVRRAQLHYMRDRSGKAARLKESPVKAGSRGQAHPWLKGAEPKADKPKADATPAETKAKTKADANPDQKPTAPEKK
jgi:large subunit ribosomal protein L19